MVKMLLVVLSMGILSCGSTTYYISRHAEKAAAPAADPPLTEAGEQHAKALSDRLRSKKIGLVYSTNFIRTQSTAAPTAQYFGLSINNYSPANQISLVDSLKKATASNVLIVGHSNTVDDIVNRFMGTDSIKDLPDTEYGSLFIVRKKGKKYTMEKLSAW